VSSLKVNYILQTGELSKVKLCIMQFSVDYSYKAINRESLTRSSLAARSYNITKIDWWQRKLVQPRCIRVETDYK